jgi:hypothetical protein
MSVNLIADYFGIRKNKIPQEFDARFADESLCKKCGRCCYGSIQYRGKLAIIRELPCKYLLPHDNKTNTCSIYSERQTIAKWCQRVSRESVHNGLFPDDCPYVAGIPGYRGKMFLSGEEEIKYYSWLRKIFTDQPKPEYLNESDWQRFLVKLAINKPG